MASRVVNIHKEKCDVYVGRKNRDNPGKWGNPFVIGKDGTRRQVCDKHLAYAEKQYTKEDLEELRNKILGCFCKPERCHGDNYIILLRRYFPEDYA